MLTTQRFHVNPRLNDPVYFKNKKYHDWFKFIDQIYVDGAPTTSTPISNDTDPNSISVDVIYSPTETNYVMINKERFQITAVQTDKTTTNLGLSRNDRKMKIEYVCQKTINEDQLQIVKYFIYCSDSNRR